MMMDETEDVEQTLQRLQREWLLDGNEDIEKPYTPSYCYGCARTAGVAVCRKPPPKRKERKRDTSSSSIARSYWQKHSKSRTIPQVKSASNLQVSAKIRKKAMSTLLGQKTGKATNNHSTQENSTKKPLAKKMSKGRGVYPCNECGQVFTFRYNLRRHQKRHSCVMAAKEYLCTECGDSFSAKKTYLRHLKIHTPLVSAAEEYLCRECGDTFSVKKTYLQHVQYHKSATATATDPDRPYACDECDKTFSRVMYLSQHKRIHDSTRPFGCQYCARMFKSKYQLTCHEETHLNIRPYPCQFCGMAFTRDSYRRMHEHVHTKTLKV